MKILNDKQLNEVCGGFSWSVGGVGGQPGGGGGFGGSYRGPCFPDIPPTSGGIGLCP